MTTQNEKDLAFERAVQEELRKGKQKAEKPADKTAPIADEPAGGLVPALLAFVNAARETTIRCAKAVYNIVRPFVAPVVCIGSGLIKGGIWSLKSMSLKKDRRTGEKHFDPLFLARNALIVTMVAVMGAAVAKPVAMGAYYYGTQHTYENVYVANAGVFANQQFNHPNKPGKYVATRDEIFTVLGRQELPNGEQKQIRFDLDTNLYFAFHADSLRPDLAAAKIIPQSPYGARCTLKTTGMYNRIPRFFQAEALKWWDLRSHIVQVVKCEQLDQNYQPIRGSFKDVRVINGGQAVAVAAHPAG